LKQLIDPTLVEKVLLYLAVAGPLVGLILGALLGAHEVRAARTVVKSTLLGMICTLIYAMWWVYGLITNALGLDSVANLVLQLILFAVVGAALGAVMFKVSLYLKRRWI